MDAPVIGRRERQFGLALRAQVTAAELGTAPARLLPRVYDCAAGLNALSAGAPFLRYLGFAADGRFAIEVGVPTLDPMPGDADILSMELEGGECVSLVHTGPYARLAETHAVLDEWFESSGRRPAGCRWEAYLTDPGAEPDESTWRTLITQPLEPER